MNNRDLAGLANDGEKIKGLQFLGRELTPSPGNKILSQACPVAQAEGVFLADNERLLFSGVLSLHQLVRQLKGNPDFTGNLGLSLEGIILCPQIHHLKADSQMSPGWWKWKFFGVLCGD